jgi:hypothetical protein
MDLKAANNLEKSTEPNPVTRSHPAAAKKPCEQHTVAVQVLSPDFSSLAKLLCSLVIHQ